MILTFLQNFIQLNMETTRKNPTKLLHAQLIIYALFHSEQLYASLFLLAFLSEFSILYLTHSFDPQICAVGFSSEQLGVCICLHEQFSHFNFNSPLLLRETDYCYKTITFHSYILFEFSQFIDTCIIICVYFHFIPFCIFFLF